MHLNRTFGRQKSAGHGVWVSWPSFEEGKREKRRKSKSLRNLEKKWRQFRALSRYGLFFKLEYRSHAIRLTAARCTRPIVRKIYVTVWRLIYREPMPFRSGQINVATKRGELYTINGSDAFYHHLSSFVSYEWNRIHEKIIQRASRRVNRFSRSPVRNLWQKKVKTSRMHVSSRYASTIVGRNEQFLRWIYHGISYSGQYPSFALLYTYNATISYNTYKFRMLRYRNFMSLCPVK